MNFQQQGIRLLLMILLLKCNKIVIVCSCLILASPLNEIVNAVNEVGAAPGDLVAILEALKQAGALKAELIVI